MAASAYHDGEREMQRKTGEEFFANRNEGIIVPRLVPGAAKYIEQQPFVIVSSQDEHGRIWTSILSGQEGYIRVVDEKTVCIIPSLIHSNPADCFWENIKTYPFMGMLFIEPATRRRYRVNGQISLSPDQVLLSVEQAYANCPKYIQGRSVSRGLKPTYLANIVRGTTLMDDLISWIKIADTFYVGSSNGEQALDASHRGGNPGFVEVLNPTTLQIPDYKGNSMYNTLGNFLIYPKAGLLFIDFKTLRTLQLTGTARVIQKEQSLLSQKSETGRYWVFSAEEWMLLENISDTNWSFIDYSPFNPA